MKKAIWAVALLVLGGLMAMPTYAAELRVTGLFDNLFPTVHRNGSVADGDLTNNKDSEFYGRERARFFFNFIASDDLRGIFALEIDQAYGAPSRNQFGSRCVPDAANAATIAGQRVLLQNFDACGFRNQIDNNSLELKNLYVDFRIPQLGIGNRWQIGGIPADVTPLHPHLLFTMDAGGGNVKFDFSDQVSLLLHYIQLEEDLDVNSFNTLANSTGTRRGEDYLTGGTLMLKPIPGLDLHLIGIYGHLHQPFGADVGIGTSGSFTGVQNAMTNIVTESRYYVGFDSRYKLGNLSIEPTFIYLLGTRKFSSASAALTGFNDTNIRAFETQLAFQYTAGPWFLAAKGAYHSGNKAGDDINNQGFAGTRRTDAKVFFPMGIDGFHRFGEYLEILGRQEADGGISLLLNGSPGERGTFDRFGLIEGIGKAEYSWTDRLILEGAVGTVWSAEKTGCPAVLRTPSGACSTTGATTASGVTFNPWNFTGNSRHLGEEIDVGFRYTIMQGLIWQQRFGWAFLGDGFQILNRHVQDSWMFTNRLLYTF